MRWEGRRQSGNIEDRRGMRVSRGGLVGGGLGTLAIALLVMFLGGDPTPILQGAGNAPVQTTSEPYVESPEEERQARLRRHDARRDGRPLDTAVRRHGRRVPETHAGPVPRSRGDRLRRRGFRRGTVLLPARRGRLPRHDLLRRDGGQAPGRRRLRLCLRGRARGGPPRAEPPRDLRPRERNAPARQRSRGQPALGAHRAAGRLLRRHVRQLRQGAGHHRAGRLRGRPARRVGHRRRPPAAQFRAAWSFRIPSRTARRSSASAGSIAGSRRAPSKPATPSRPPTSRLRQNAAPICTQNLRVLAANPSAE